MFAQMLVDSKLVTMLEWELILTRAKTEYYNDGLEVIFEKGSVFIFNGVDVDGTITKGGCSNYIVVHERFASCIIKLVLLDVNFQVSFSDINITHLMLVDS